MANEDIQNNQQAVSAEPEAEKAALTPEQKKAKGAKIFTVVTYVIALLAILAGLFVPLYGPKDAALADRMLFKYIPGFFNQLLYPFAKKDIIPLKADGFFPPAYPVEKFSSEVLAMIVYAITCVVGLVMLIPVLLGKKEKRTSAICAYVVETLAVLSSGYFLFAVLTEFAWEMEFAYFNLLITFGGALLIMTIQSIRNKGGLGVTKLILAILSAVIFLFLINLFVLPESVTKIFANLSKALGSGETAQFANGTVYEEGIFGIYFIEVLKDGAEIGMTEKIFYIVGGILTCLCLFNFAFDVFTIATGSKYDEKGLFNQNKPMSVIAIIRYALALLLAIASIVLLLIIKNVKPGIYLYLITLVLLIQLIFVIIRAAVLASKRRKAVKEDAATVKPQEAPVFEDNFSFGDTDYSEESVDTITIETPVYEDEEYVYDNRVQPAEQPVENTEPYYEQVPIFEEPESEETEQQEIYEEEPEPEPEQTEEPEPEQRPVQQKKPVYEEPEPVFEDEDEEEPETEEPKTQTEERTYVYNYRAIYNGPTDDFMDTLDDAQKIEFVQVFLEKKKGQIKGIPDYEIGHENENFFPSVFIHINRAREVVSSGLLEKIYKRIGKN